MVEQSPSTVDVNYLCSEADCVDAGIKLTFVTKFYVSNWMAWRIEELKEGYEDGKISYGALPDAEATSNF